MTPEQVRRRLGRLMVAGLVDSLCLSFAWTVIMLQVVATYGLPTAGVCSAAMLVGVSLSAPAAGRAALWLNGRRLLRTAAAAEAVLRMGVFMLLFTEAPVWVLALCVSAMNVTAWTGYAGMRAEVTAISPGASALTWYGTGVAAVEAAGVALAALLPVTSGASADTILLAVMVVYVLALLPTALVAGGSPVPRAHRPAPAMQRLRGPRVSSGTVGGVVLMCVASAPPLLAVALAAEFHGRAAVALAAIAFTVGSLTAPAVSSRIQARDLNNPTIWVLCALVMVVGWIAAPWSVAAMCGAQVLAGLGMTSLEGLLDTHAAMRHPQAVTGALARATAGRALGSAAGTAVLPLLVAGVGLTTTMATAAVALAFAAVVTQVVRVAASRGALPGHRRPVAAMASPSGHEADPALSQTG